MNDLNAAVTVFAIVVFAIVASFDALYLHMTSFRLKWKHADLKGLYDKQSKDLGVSNHRMFIKESEMQILRDEAAELEHELHQMAKKFEAASAIQKVVAELEEKNKKLTRECAAMKGADTRRINQINKLIDDDELCASHSNIHGGTIYIPSHTTVNKAQKAFEKLVGGAGRIKWADDE